MSNLIPHKEIEQKIGVLRPGEHTCCIYNSEDEHRALLTPFITQGLSRGEKIIYFIDVHRTEDIISYLKNEGLEAKQFLKSGQLLVIPAAESYTRKTVFDPDAMISLLEEETERALTEGYPALRVTGEMTWALRGTPGSNRLIEYEEKLNEFFPQKKCLAMCQYKRGRFFPSFLLKVISIHPVVM